MVDHLPIQLTILNYVRSFGGIFADEKGIRNSL
jgi:hypothetical protein